MVTVKQAYEWAKTGHWTLHQFTDWMVKQQFDSRTDELVSTYCKAWEQSFTADNPYHTVQITLEDRKHIEAGLKAALAEQPAQQQEPVFCEYCGGNDETPQDHCMDCVHPRWVPVTQELLNNQHPWLYEPMWIAMKNGTVIQGYYEWRQGRNPDRFLTNGGDEWALDAAYVMPIVKPTPPSPLTEE